MKAFIKTKEGTFVEAEIISTIYDRYNKISINRIKTTTQVNGFHTDHYYINEESVKKDSISRFTNKKYFNDGYYLYILNKRCKVNIYHLNDSFTATVYYWDANHAKKHYIQHSNISHIEHFIGQENGFYLVKKDETEKLKADKNDIGDSFIDAFNKRERNFLADGKKYYLSEEECKDDNKPVIIKMDETKKKKYKVHLGYYTSIDVEVTAENESEAKENAYAEIARDKYDNELLGGLEAESCEINEI